MLVISSALRSAIRSGVVVSALGLCLGACATSPLATTALSSAPPQLRDPTFAGAAEALAAAKARPQPGARAKNVILIVGDGMGVATVTAARIRAGEMQGVDGESYQLAIDAMPYTAFSKTYSHDYQVSDSAATATAMVAGVKTRSGVVGVASSVERGDCPAALSAPVESLFDRAEAAGKATGLVSTARVTHATPASVYAHAASRDWENDVELGQEAAAQGCIDIARQLVEWSAGDGLEIALGGGRAQFLPLQTADPEHDGRTGARGDGRDLIEAWTSRSDDHVFAWNAQMLADADLAGGAKVLGLFEPSHMQYEIDRPEDPGGEPSIAQMTRAAISRLAQDEDGYVLMVEGGRVDHAHHAGNAARALADAVALDAAVAAALEMTSREDTLVLFTADHSHTLTIAGYPARGAPILGLAVGPDGAPARAADGKPYTTLGYINGPGTVFAPATPDGLAPPAGPRPDLTDVDVHDHDYRQQALVPGYSETHAGEDVGIYADGPGAHLISGTVEQNYIYHVLADALGL